MKLSIISMCLLGLALTATAKVRYDNYKVYRFVPNNEEQRKVLLTLEEQNPGVLFWKGVRHVGQPVDIMFPPHLQADLLESLMNLGMQSSVYIENVQTLVDQDEQSVKRSEISPRLTWDDYYSTAQIHAFLDEAAAANPGVVSVVSAGQSYEGRELKIIKIERGNTRKPIIWLDANIHAREWITNAVATYLINELLTSTDPEIQRLSEDFDWHIMPVMNPDGYEFSRTQGNRLWRKTRQPSSVICFGADPNRNWGFHWMEGGASNMPCSDTYGGSAAFSEPETALSSQYLSGIANNVVLYVSLHSYSQIILLPYGHNNQRYPDYAEYMRIGGLVSSAIASKFNTRFTYGNIVDMLYVASGGSMDWFKGTYDTDLTFTLEMRDTGRYGFLLPAEQIIDSGREFIDGLLVMAAESRTRLAAKENKLPSIHPIVAPGNKLPVIRPAIEAVGAPSLETISGPSIRPIVTPGNKLPVIRPIGTPGNKLPVIRPTIEAVGGPTLETISGPSIRPIVTPGNKLPAIRPTIEAVGGPSLEAISAPSIRPIVTPGNKLPAVRPPISGVGSPVLAPVSRPSILPVVRPGNKLPTIGKPIIF